MSKGRDKLIESSIQLFSSNTYENVSISQICKNGKVSNGLFYKHFKNKEEIFKYLLEETSNRIENYFNEIFGNSIQDRLESFIEINFKLTKDQLPLIRVYREGQYKFTEFEQKLREVYLNALNTVFGRGLDEFEYIFIMSGIRYINVNFVTRGIENNPKFLAKILMNGFFQKSTLNIISLKEKDLYLRVLFNSENIRHQLLKEGEILFGSKGVYDTKVNDIVDAVGTGVGSFYYYYKTKEEFLKEIAINIKNTLLFFLKDNSQNRLSPIDQHIFFLYLMHEYFKKSTYKYQILRELEFIEYDVSIDYFRTLEEYYINTLDKTTYRFEEKRIISAVLIGLSHYMGIEFFFTKNLNNKEDFLNKMSHFLSSGIKNAL
jgi:AcrR family transcriptional regulator